MTFSKSRIAFLAVIAAFVGVAVVAHGAYEVHHYITDNYPGLFSCPSKDTVYNHSMLQDYRAEMISWGWSETMKHNNVYPSMSPPFFNLQILIVYRDLSAACLPKKIDRFK